MRLPVAALMCLILCLAWADPTPAAESADSLLGSWKLVSIDFSGPNGPIPDPVFGPDPHGLIIYDRSGWMSVQIYTAHRPPMTEPASRTSASVSDEEARTKAAAMDTYYAYFGTWTYDASTSTITHHLQNSLLPYEIGRDLKRAVKLSGTQLTLTVELKVGNETRHRVLKWERIASTTQH